MGSNSLCEPQRLDLDLRLGQVTQVEDGTTIGEEGGVWGRSCMAVSETGEEKRVMTERLLTGSKEENVSQSGLETGQPRSILVDLGTGTQGAADIERVLLGDVTLKRDSGQLMNRPLRCEGTIPVSSTSCTGNKRPPFSPEQCAVVAPR